MQQGKANTKPFWALVILTSLVLLFWLFTLMVGISLSYSEVRITSFIIKSIIILAILVVECILYWILRRRFYKVFWVWTHISLLYFSLLFLVFGASFAQVILSKYLHLVEPDIWRGRRMLRVQVFLYWSGIVIAHFFFVLTIVRSFSIKQSSEKGHNESSRVLDEFHG